MAEKRNMKKMIKDTLLLEAMVDTFVSVSSEINSIMSLNEAYVEADKAKNIGAIFELEDKCFQYCNLGLEKMIYSIPMDACVRYVKETFGEGFISDKASEELLKTVKAYLYSNFNISVASRAIYIHRNTLMYNWNTKLSGNLFSGFYKLFSIFRDFIINIFIYFLNI